MAGGERRRPSKALSTDKARTVGARYARDTAVGHLRNALQIIGGEVELGAIEGESTLRILLAVSARIQAALKALGEDR